MMNHDRVPPRLMTHSNTGRHSVLKIITRRPGEKEKGRKKNGATEGIPSREAHEAILNEGSVLPHPTVDLKKE